MLNNVKEKELIVTRQILIDKITPSDEVIISIWGKLFPDDKLKLLNQNNTELFEWIRRHVNSNGIKSCNEQLERIRRKGERNLKTKGKYIGYGAKLIKQPENGLATYDIFTKGQKYSGNYESLLRRIGQLPKQKM